MNTIIVIRSDSMGEGDPGLGARLLGSFLRTLTQTEPRPDAIVFYNAAVKTLGPASPHVEALRTLDAAGVDLLACVTCLEHFQLTQSLAVGTVSNMREITARLLAADKVISI